MAKKMDMKEVNSKLDMLRMVHGREITYTNGLFHSYDDRHREAYINPSTGEFDRRGLYNTLVVMDNIVVAKVINNEKIKFVVLNKSNLDCVYKTRGNIYYIDDSLVCDKFKEHCLLISHTGKKTWKFRDTLCINKIKTKGNYYLVSSSEMYQDKLIAYYPQKDLIRNMTEDKRYTLSRITDTKIQIVDMYGGKYIYDFETKQCFDDFTGKLTDSISIFS